MESAAPISDMITGLTLYCRLVEDIIEGETELTLTEYRMLFFLSMTPDKRARIHTLAEALYLSASTISDAAKNLEALGFIEKADVGTISRLFGRSLLKTASESSADAQRRSSSTPKNTGASSAPKLRRFISPRVQSSSSIATTPFKPPSSCRDKPSTPS
ncbi:MarR family transcriptional regulator [Adlercreutzia rubneri]